jgi:2-C-methyl-D-erythritol 4-phosphate cytidylyltransferase
VTSVPHPAGKNRAVAVVVAGGTGRRTGLRVPKQFLKIRGRTLLDHVLDRFSRHRAIGQIIVVVPRARISALGYLTRRHPKISAIVAGGARRQDSVLKGIEQVESSDSTIVVVHDAARPLVPSRLIGDVIRSARQWGAAVPGVSVPDTVKEVTPGGRVKSTLRRERLRLIQTPQAFRIGWLRAAAKKASGPSVWTDEAAMLEASGRRVQVVPGSVLNFKVTTAGDVRRVKELLG